VVVDGEEELLALDSDEEKDENKSKMFNMNLPDFCIIDNFSSTF